MQLKGKHKLIKTGVYVESETKPFYKGEVVKIPPEGYQVYIETKDVTKKRQNIIYWLKMLI